jgi:hypothetical protein
MDKKTVIAFNVCYAAVTTEAQKQLVNDLLFIWGKLEPAAKKNPALLRRGVLFGMALQSHIEAGNIALPEVRAKRKDKATTEQQEPGQTTSF